MERRPIFQRRGLDEGHDFFAEGHVYERRERDAEVGDDGGQRECLEGERCIVR